MDGGLAWAEPAPGRLLNWPYVHSPQHCHRLSRPGSLALASLVFCARLKHASFFAQAVPRAKAAPWHLSE